MTRLSRITVTLSPDLVEEIDRWDRNRSRFLTVAIREELERRRRAALKRSLDSPHQQATELAEAGFDDWASGLPADDAAGLVDLDDGTPVRWVPGEGWREEDYGQSETGRAPSRERGWGRDPTYTRQADYRTGPGGRAYGVSRYHAGENRGFGSFTGSDFGGRDFTGSRFTNQRRYPGGLGAGAPGVGAPTGRCGG